MDTQPVTLRMDDIQAKVSSEWPSHALREEIARIQRHMNRKIVVLDDDPTGVQTVHDIYVLADWSLALLREAFQRPDPLFYILTNTRAYGADVAARINREIACNVYEVSREMGMDVVFVSRGDSTLRGHYPLETDTLADEVERLGGAAVDGHLLIPAFFEGGRITYQNTHFIREHDTLTPVHQTEFSKDKVFGYEHGDLTQWVEEKTHGKWSAADCVCISVEAIRQGPERVEELLRSVSGNLPVIVNALSYADLDVLSLALLRVEQQGKKFIFRTAASFVKSYAGIETIDVLSRDLLITKGHEQYGGLVVVGSYVQKTTRQLEQLLQRTSVVPVEMDVAKVLDLSSRGEELQILTKEINRRLTNGESVVVYSSRKLIASENQLANLDIGQTVSQSLVQLVQSLQVTPKFMVAKGGITSSDVATKGLGIRQALVIGQAAPGVPVWRTGAEAKFPNIPYIVFPGNVGDDLTLAEVVERMA